MTKKKDLMQMTAADLMTTNVVTATSDLTLDGLALIFSANKVTGVPVIDGENNVVGVVSETDLVRHQADHPEATQDDWSFFRRLDLEELELVGDGFHVEELPDAEVVDIMSTNLATVEESSSIQEIAAYMIRRRVHRLLVVKDRKLRGIISTMDLVRALATHPDGPALH